MSARHADALLELLAEVALTPGTAEPGIDVRTLAWAGHSPEELAAAWEPFHRAVREREAMATGERDRTDVDPDAADLADALERASARIDRAYQALVWGRNMRTEVRQLRTSRAS